MNGIHPTAGHVLEFLGLDTEDCGRFRDAYITSDGVLAVFTRCGGGNHQDYHEVYAKLATHPNYLRYEYDDFDSTYSTFYFSVPDEYKTQVNNYLNITKDQRPDLLRTPMERFKQKIDDMGSQ